MPDPDPNVSSQSMGSLSGKPADEKQSPGDGSGMSPEPDRPSFEQVTGELATAKQQLATVEKNYADSNRAGQQNYQLQQQSALENQRLRMRLDELEQPSQNVAPDLKTICDEQAVIITEASQLGEDSKVSESLYKVGKAFQDQGAVDQHMKQTAKDHQNLRVGESKSYLDSYDQQWSNREHPLTKRAYEIYDSLFIQKQNGTGSFDIVDETIPWKHMDNRPVNPHMLKRAHMEAGQEYAQQALAGTLPPASDIAPTLQPSRPGGAVFASGTAGNSLLTEGERATASIYKMTEEEFFAELDPRMQAARKRARKPVTNEELVMVGLASASDIDKSPPR
jgi:ubiquitin